MVASLKVPAEPVDSSAETLWSNEGFVVDEKLTAKKQKIAAKALAKATTEGKVCRQSATKLT